MANGLVDYRLIDPNMPAKAGTSWMQGFQQAQQDTAQEIQNRSAMQQYQNALAEAEAYKAAGGDYNKLQQELMSRGQGKAALGVAKQVSEIEKAGLETRLKKVELNRETFSNLRFNPSDENVLAHLQDQILRKDITPQQAERMYAHILGMDPKQRVIYFTEMGAKADTAYKELKLQSRHEDEMGIKRGQLGVAQGQLDESRRAHNLQYDPNVVANTVTDSAGNVTQFNRFGQVVGTPGKVGKPSATYEKTEALKKQQSIDLDRAIKELTDVTKDGGLIDQSTGSGIGRATDVTASFFGKATPGAIAIGKLQPIADMALKMVPRFEGPQSDKDTKSYKEAAGQLADPNLPTEIRKEAGKTVLRLMKERKGQFVSEGMAAEGIGAGGVDTSNPLLK